MGSSISKTPKEALLTQVERVVRLYDRGLVGLDELDAIRDELLGEPNGPWVAELLESENDPQIQAFLRGEPIPDLPLEEIVERDALADSRGGSGADAVEKSEELKNQGEAEGSSGERKSSSMSPLWVVLSCGVAGLVVFGLLEGRARWVESERTPEISKGPIPQPAVVLPTGSAEKPESVAARPQPFGLEPAEWSESSMRWVVAETCRQTKVEALGDLWNRSRSSLTFLFPDESKGEGEDIRPWRDPYYVESLGREDDLHFGYRAVFLRAGFSELGEAGLYAMEWEIRGPAVQRFGIEEAMGKEASDEGLNGMQPEWFFPASPEKKGLVWQTRMEGKTRIVGLYAADVLFKIREMARGLAQPLGAYTDAKKALFERDGDLDSALSFGREAVALFGSVHSRMFHGHTVVNLCRVHLMQGNREEATLRCRMAHEHSLERNVRAEAQLLLARMALWKDDKERAVGLLQGALLEAKQIGLQRRIHLYLARLEGKEWSRPELLRVVNEVGCEKGKGLGVSWQWLPMEFGFTGVDNMLVFAKNKFGLESDRIFADSIAKCQPY